MELYINDVMQVGGGGSNLCGTLYKGLIKTVILMWQKCEGGGQIPSNFRDIINECPYAT